RQIALALIAREMLLLIARAYPLELRQDPDLQKMRAAIIKIIEFAMHHACAGTHALDVARSDNTAVRRAGFAVTHAVLMGKLAIEHVADDLHVPVAVRPKTMPGGDRVIIDDTEVTPALVIQIEVITKRESVGALQPTTMGGSAAFLRSA